MCAEETNSSSSAADSSRGTEELARALEELRGANGRLVIAGIRMQELADQAETARHHAEAARAEAEAAAADNARLYQNAQLEIERRTRAEQALSEGWQRFQALVDASAEIVWTTDPNGAVVEDSPSWRAFTGQTLEQWQGFGWLAAIHPDDHARVRELWSNAVGERTPVDTEYRVRHISGDWRWQQVRAVPVFNPDGSVREWVGMNTDVTERKHAEENLRDSEQRFTRFMHHLPGLAWIKDSDGRYVYANDAAQTAFRTGQAELYGKSDAEVFPPETAALFRSNDRQAIESESSVQTVEALKHADGKVHHSIVNKFPIPGTGGGAAMVGG